MYSIEEESISEYKLVGDALLQELFNFMKGFEADEDEWSISSEKTSSKP